MIWVAEETEAILKVPLLPEADPVIVAYRPTEKLVEKPDRPVIVARPVAELAKRIEIPAPDPEPPPETVDRLVAPSTPQGSRASLPDVSLVPEDCPLPLAWYFQPAARRTRESFQIALNVSVEALRRLKFVA